MILKYIIKVDQTAVASENDSPITTYRGMAAGSDMADCVKHLPDSYQRLYEPITELHLMCSSSIADEEGHIIETSSEECQDSWEQNN